MGRQVVYRIWGRGQGAIGEDRLMEMKCMSERDSSFEKTRSDVRCT
jgi:hypothetical protein